MHSNSKLTRNLSVTAFMLLIIVVRVLSGLYGFEGLSSFSPLGAMALFGGAYFSGFSKYLFPLATLWISDILLTRLVYAHEWQLFYDSFYWTYGAFALMALTGHLLMRKVNVRNFTLSSLLIVFIHWIITDLGVWITGTMYPKTAGGFAACLAAAIPFELNFLGGTIIYGVFMFGGFEWLKIRFPQLRKTTA